MSLDRGPVSRLVWMVVREPVGSEYECACLATWCGVLWCVRGDDVGVGRGVVL